MFLSPENKVQEVREVPYYHMVFVRIPKLSAQRVKHLQSILCHQQSGWNLCYSGINYQLQLQIEFQAEFSVQQKQKTSHRMFVWCLEAGDVAIMLHPVLCLEAKRKRGATYGGERFFSNEWRSMTKNTLRTRHNMEREMCRQLDIHCLSNSICFCLTLLACVLLPFLRLENMKIWVSFSCLLLQAILSHTSFACHKSEESERKSQGREMVCSSGCSSIRCLDSHSIKWCRKERNTRSWPSLSHHMMILLFETRGAADNDHPKQKELLLLLLLRQTSRDQSYVEWVIVSFTWYHTQAWVHVSDQREFLPWWSFFPFSSSLLVSPLSSKYDLRFYSKNFKTERIPESSFAAAAAAALLIIITWREKAKRSKTWSRRKTRRHRRKRKQEQAVRRRETIKW